MYLDCRRRVLKYVKHFWINSDDERPTIILKIKTFSSKPQYLTFLHKGPDSRSRHVWSLDSFLPELPALTCRQCLGPGTPSSPTPGVLELKMSKRCSTPRPGPAWVYNQRPAKLSSVRSGQCSCYQDTCRLIQLNMNAYKVRYPQFLKKNNKFTAN